MNYRWVWLLCAWVLWAINGEVVQPTGAWPVHEECAKEQDKQEALAAINQMVALQLDNRYVARLRFLCLPDTVDPRGPKNR